MTTLPLCAWMWNKRAFNPCRSACGPSFLRATRSRFMFSSSGEQSTRRRQRTTRYHGEHGSLRQPGRQPARFQRAKFFVRQPPQDDYGEHLWLVWGLGCIHERSRRRIDNDHGRWNGLVFEPWRSKFLGCAHLVAVLWARRRISTAIDDATASIDKPVC